MLVFDEFDEDVLEKLTKFSFDIINSTPPEYKYKLTPMLSQLDILCKTIYDIPQLANGFDFIGMSQGGILARGYTEYCNKFKVRNA